MALKFEGDKKHMRLTQGLGAEKLGIVTNMLASGKELVQIARMIQGEWGLMQDSTEKSLGMLLSRYRDSVPNAATTMMDGTLIVTASLERVNVVHELAHLIAQQKGRLAEMLMAEKSLKSKHDSSLGREIELMKNLLLDMQKIQFDLGVDAYKGPVFSNGKVISANVTTPDGTNVSLTIGEDMREAMDVIEQFQPKRQAITDVDSR